MPLRYLLPFLLILPLLSCTHRNPQPQPEPEKIAPQQPCPFVYVYAPGNYIIDIAGGSQVILDPGAQEFELFCSPGEARAAATAAIDKGLVPEGDWRVYRLSGELEDLAQPMPNGKYTLKRMAQIVDWVTEN